MKTLQEEFGNITQHESGLRFRPPTLGQGDFSDVGYCWGQMLDNPQFRSLDEFRQSFKDLDSVKLKKLYRYGNEGELKEIPERMAVVSEKHDFTYNTPTEKYVPVQDIEVFNAFANILENAGLKNVYGRIDQKYLGRVRANIIIADPNFVVSLLERYDDYIMLGYKVFNSHTGETSFGAKAIGVRMICCNYNVWGDLLQEIVMKHMDRARNAVRAFELMLDDTIKAIPKFQNFIKDTHSRVVVKEEIADILWGIELPMAGIEAITQLPEAFTPEISELGLTAWTLYNAVTGYITYRSGSGHFLDRTETLAEKATDILKVSHDELIEKGRVKRTAYEEKQKEKLKVRVVA